MTTTTDPAQQVADLTAQILDDLHRAHAASEADPPLEVNADGWIADGDKALIASVESPRRQTLAFDKPGNIEAIVWHWTDTRGCGAVNLAQRISTMAGRAASWHTVIDANGIAVQSVSAKHGSWHAGGADAALFTRSSGGDWDPLAPAQRGRIAGYSANAFAFGIELENVGEVRLVDRNGQWTWVGWPFAFGTQYGAPANVPDTEVAAIYGADGRPIMPVLGARSHQVFTDAQVTTARRITRALAQRYGLTRKACSLGHCQIDPQNRTDPGPLWLGSPIPPLGSQATGGHLKEILDAVFGI